MSPAALELARAGITGPQLADDLGVTRAAVSFQLCGKSARMPQALLDAIADRGGPDLARTVELLVNAERARRRINETARQIADMTAKPVAGRNHVEA